MKKIAAMLLAATLAWDAEAASCFNADQVNAEQMIRLHSELMVTMLTCRQSNDGKSLTKAYQSFTQKNLSRIKEAERTLMDFYRSVGSNASGRMDKLRTRYANEYSQQAADASLPAFCSMWADKVVLATRWTPVQLQYELNALAARYATEVPACERPRSAKSKPATEQVAEDTASEKIEAATKSSRNFSRR